MTITVVGDNIVDVFDELGVASVGGNCLNVAVNLRRLGIPTRYIGNVGDDDLGTAVLDELDSEGIDLNDLRRTKGESTGYAFIRLVGGERYFGDFDRGAGVVHLDEARWNVLRSADLIHTSYSSEVEDDIDRLRMNAPLSFDFDSHIDDDYARSLVPFVDHGFFSAADINETEIDRNATKLLASGMTTVTMTRAERGAIHYRKTGKWSADVEDVNPIDTLGAGDAFIAGILAGITTSMPVQAILQQATGMASAVCKRVGSLGLYIDPTLVGPAKLAQ